MTPEERTALIARVKELDAKATPCPSCKGMGYFMDTTYNRTGEKAVCPRCSGDQKAYPDGFYGTVRTAAPILARECERLAEKLKLARASNHAFSVLNEEHESIRSQLTTCEEQRDEAKEHYQLAMIEVRKETALMMESKSERDTLREQLRIATNALEMLSRCGRESVDVIASNALAAIAAKEQA